MAHIVVIGVGLGGVPAALELRKHVGKEHRLTVIACSPHLEFVGSNPWIAVGWRNCDRWRSALHGPLESRGIQWIAEAVVAIDAATRRLYFRSGWSLPYDRLVIAGGSASAVEPAPLRGLSWPTPLACTYLEPRHAWTQYQQFLQHPGPLVVAAAGAGGFGAAYELALLFDADLRQRTLRECVAMSFVTCEPRIGQMDVIGVNDSSCLLEHELRQRRIQWYTNTRVEQVRAGEMCLVQRDPRTGSTQHCTLPFKYAMVISEATSIPAAVKVPALCDVRGSMLVDEQQRSLQYPNIFSADAGDSGGTLQPMVQALCESLECWPHALHTVIAPRFGRVSVQA